MRFIHSRPLLLGTAALGLQLFITAPLALAKKPAPAPAAAPAAKQQSLFDEAKVLFDRRAEGATGFVAKDELVTQAIDKLKESIANGENEEAAGALLLQAYYFKGTFTGKSDEEAKAIYNAGKDIGETLLKKHPNSPSLHYWLAVEWGRWSEVYGILQAAKEGVAGKVRSLSTRLIELDKNFDDGAGYRILGRLHHKAPGILFWPSNKTALENLRKALEVAPNNRTNQLFLADLLVTEKQYAEAKTLLEKISSTPPAKDRVVEDRRDIETAKALLEKLPKSAS